MENYTTRQQKVGRLVQKELAEIFTRSRPVAGNFLVTITVVRMSRDLSFAKVYLSIFGEKNKEAVVKKMSARAGEFRRELGFKMRKQLRIIPEIAFYIDDSLDYAEKIDKLLRDG